MSDNESKTVTRTLAYFQAAGGIEATSSTHVLYADASELRFPAGERCWGIVIEGDTHALMSDDGMVFRYQSRTSGREVIVYND